MTTSTIVVPEGGLYFRAPDRTPIARLSRGAHGADFALFDEHQAARPAREVKVLTPSPYSDADDPWTKPAQIGERPGPGF